MILDPHSFVARLFLYLFLHFPADFSQSAWMAVNKKRPSEDEKRIEEEPWYNILLFHVLCYTAWYYIVAYFVALVGGGDINLLGPLFVGVSHGFVDFLKSTGRIKKIWVDQLLHLLCNIPPVYLDWL